MTFNVEVEREDDGRWIAEVTDVPGAMAYGQTSEEAVSRAEDLGSAILSDQLK
jgi:predicted RNase H-like HicB family nuclease